MILPVYITHENAKLGCHISPASGIVGKPIENTDLVKVYFEGNKYGACNLNTFLDRLIVASGRCADNAPTTAFTVIAKNELTIIGTMDTDDYSLTLFKSKREAITLHIKDMPLCEEHKLHKVSIID